MRTADSHFEQGLEYLDNGDYDKAITEFSEFIRIIPGFVNAYFNRGVAYLEKNDYDRAITNFETVLRIDQNHAGAKRILEEARQARGY